MKLLSIVKPDDLFGLPFVTQVVASDLQVNDLQVANELTFGANGPELRDPDPSDQGTGFRFILPEDVARLQGYVVVAFGSKESRAWRQEHGRLGIPAACDRLTR